MNPSINGHLAWTAQNASGNRGDDFRALKLCEIQPHTFAHPIHDSVKIFALLALQGEEKAGAHRGMRTVRLFRQGPSLVKVDAAD